MSGLRCAVGDVIWTNLGFARSNVEHVDSPIKLRFLVSTYMDSGCKPCCHGQGIGHHNICFFMLSTGFGCLHGQEHITAKTRPPPGDPDTHLEEVAQLTIASAAIG